MNICCLDEKMQFHGPVSPAGFEVSFFAFITYS